MDICWILTPTSHSLIFCNVWTDIGLDKLWTKPRFNAPLGPLADIGHCLDNYGIWTDSGLILDLMIYILISNFLLYDLGQRLDINRTRQILDSSWI